jgi:hypothetical protein
MESLRSLPAATLTWEVVERGEPLRALRANETTVAELRWAVGFAAEGATATTSDGAWTFDRRGMLTKQVVIEPHGGIAGAFDAGGWEGGGTLETELGTRFIFAPASLLATRWAFSIDGAAPFVSFHVQRRRIFGSVEVARIEPAGVGAPELPLLVTLGSWLTVLARRDQGSGPGGG